MGSIERPSIWWPSLSRTCYSNEQLTKGVARQSLTKRWATGSGKFGRQMNYEHFTREGNTKATHLSQSPWWGSVKPPTAPRLRWFWMSGNCLWARQGQKVTFNLVRCFTFNLTLCTLAMLEVFHCSQFRIQRRFRWMPCAYINTVTLCFDAGCVGWVALHLVLCEPHSKKNQHPRCGLRLHCRRCC